MNNCIFCAKSGAEIICENELAKAFYDGFPVNVGHVLVVPKRHLETYFDASGDELAAMQELVFQAKEILDEKYSPDGFNIGVNVGVAGGQSVFHLHLHVIPRYAGDVENPRGGIRRFKKSVVPYPLEDNGVQEYGKLVRDKMPEIIRVAGKKPVVRVAERDEYRGFLIKKLQEEAYEYLSTGNVDELGDIIEVMNAILECEGLSWAELDKIRAEKAEARGIYCERIILERVEELL